MRLLGKSGADPARRHWECINRDLLNPQSCDGYALTDADAPLSAIDIARSLDTNPLVAQETVELHQLAQRLSSAHDAYHFLSDSEHRTLIRAAHILERLTDSISRPVTRGEPMTHQARDGAHEARNRALDGFRDFTAGYDKATTLERCRTLDRYLKHQGAKGANLEKTVDQLCWADSSADAERAWAALSYRAGHIWRYDLTGGLSRDGFEEYWRDWKASRKVRAAIDQALGQEGGF